LKLYFRYGYPFGGDIVGKLAPTWAIIKKRFTIMIYILKANPKKINISRHSAGEPVSFQLQLALFRLYFLTCLFWRIQPMSVFAGRQPFAR